VIVFNRQRNKNWLLVFIAILLAACSDDTISRQSSARSTDTPAFTATSFSTPIKRTLPPTWTPTHTATLRPPTQTPRPTLTPTITPTPDVKLVCATFSLFAAPDNGIQVPADGQIAFSWTDAPSNSMVRVAVWNRESNTGIMVEWFPDQALNMPVEMSYLDESGIFDWQLSVYYEEFGDICTVEGWFEKLLPDTAAPTEDATEEATEEPTREPTEES